MEKASNALALEAPDCDRDLLQAALFQVGSRATWGGHGATA